MGPESFWLYIYICIYEIGARLTSRLGLEWSQDIGLRVIESLAYEGVRFHARHICTTHPWHIHMWTRTYSCVWHDSFLCVTTSIMIYVLLNSFMCIILNSFTAYTSELFHWTPSCVWQHLFRYIYVYSSVLNFLSATVVMSIESCAYEWVMFLTCHVCVTHRQSIHMGPWRIHTCDMSHS